MYYPAGAVLSFLNQGAEVVRVLCESKSANLVVSFRAAFLAEVFSPFKVRKGVGGDLWVAEWSGRARHKICNFFCLEIELEWIIYSI